MTQEDMARAMASAKATYDGIFEIIAKLNAANDDDVYDEMARELATAAGFTVLPNENEEYSWAKGDGSYVDATSYDDEDAAWVACCDDNNLRPDADDVQREIEEDPLSVQVRSDWVSPGDTMKPGEYEILLSTGGPAIRIVGELDSGSPTNAVLECQDWFTPWTAVPDIDEKVLLAYAECFYFGD